MKHHNSLNKKLATVQTSIWKRIKTGQSWQRIWRWTQWHTVRNKVKRTRLQQFVYVLHILLTSCRFNRQRWFYCLTSGNQYLRTKWNFVVSNRKVRIINLLILLLEYESVQFHTQIVNAIYQKVCYFSQGPPVGYIQFFLLY